MCGIAGVIAYRPGAGTEQREILALRDAQRHRGPDDAGLWIAPDHRVGLGHRRLSIIDLSPAGRQPMASADGRLRLVYNGEIYNYRELRDELRERGFAFRTQSDTEVVLQGYRAFGTGILDRLRGMFAFALHDAEAGETLLARDPLGIKPLYWLDDGSRVLFASEVQALRGAADAGGVDPEGLAAYLLWGSIAPPRTLYRRIRALRAGSFARVRAGGEISETAYFSLESCLGRSEPMAEAEAGPFLRDALLDSARAHLVSDVPVGAFLSGGVDSSALVGLLAEAGPGSLRTTTLAFDAPELDESAHARRAAELYGSDQREVPIRIDEIRERIPDAIRALDQPSVDGVNTYFVAEAAARSGLKVAVSGVGGDELFGGYVSFRRVPAIRRAHRALPDPLGRALARGVEALPARRWRGKLARALAFGGDDAGAYYAERGIATPREVRALLAPEAAEAVDAVDPLRELRGGLRLGDLAPEERVSALELSRYLGCQLLRDTDAVAMRHSLEVRTPLVDRVLLERAARVPPVLRRAGPAKRWLREAPRPPLPEALWRRPKRGFLLPFERWLRGDGIPVELPEHPLLRPEGLRQVGASFRAGHLHFSRVWMLIVLRHFLE